MSLVFASAGIEGEFQQRVGPGDDGALGRRQVTAANGRPPPAWPRAVSSGPLGMCREGSFPGGVPAEGQAWLRIMEPSPSSNVLVGGSGVKLGQGARAGRGREAAALIA